MIYCPKCKEVVPENLIIDKVLNKDTMFYDIYVESCCHKCGQTIKQRVAVPNINEVIIPKE